MSTDRMARVNRLLQTTLSEIIACQIKDPLLQALPVISIVEVKTTPDLRYAKIYLSIVADDEQQRLALDKLQKARKYLRTELGRSVRLRYTPELHFTLDDRLDAAARIDEILREISSEKKEQG